MNCRSVRRVPVHSGSQKVRRRAVTGTLRPRRGQQIRILRARNREVRPNALARLVRSPVRRSALPRRRPSLSTTIVWVVGTAFAVLWMWPFFWMISTSLKPEPEILSLVPRWLPDAPTWSNYARVLAYPVGQWFWNSFVVAMVSTCADGTSWRTTKTDS